MLHKRSLWLQIISRLCRTVQPPSAAMLIRTCSYGEPRGWHTHACAPPWLGVRDVLSSFREETMNLMKISKLVLCGESCRLGGVTLTALFIWRVCKVGARRPQGLMIKWEALPHLHLEYEQQWRPRLASVSYLNVNIHPTETSGQYPGAAEWESSSQS